MEQDFHELASPPQRGIYSLKARESRFSIDDRKRRLETAPPVCACGCGKRVGWDAGRCRWRRYASKLCYHPPAPHHDPKWLRARYENERMTLEEIAALSGVVTSSIARQMNKHGIARRNPSASHEGRQAGSNNPAWRGGVTPERQALYKSREWKETIWRVWRRDNFQCQRCGIGKTGKASLHAHHVASFADHPELRFALDNLVTLCRVCHLWVHSKANASRDCLPR